MKAITRGWPPARRKAQAERCCANKPWLKSTGPRTAKGKAKSRENATKHGLRGRFMRKITNFLIWQKRSMRRILALCTDIDTHKAHGFDTRPATASRPPLSWASYP